MVGISDAPGRAGRRQHLCLLIVLCCTTMTLPFAFGDETSAKSKLISKGILTRSDGLSLVDERALAKAFAEMTIRKKGLAKAVNSVTELEQQLAQSKDDLQAMIDRGNALQKQMNESAGNPIVYNSLVQDYNSNNRAIQLLIDDRKQAEKMIDERVKAVAAVRDAYWEQIRDIQSLAERISAKYADLAKDEGVNQSLSELNAATNKSLKLEPSRKFRLSLKQLETLKSTLPVNIPLRRERGGRFAAVVINGKPPQEMLVDTGCSTVLLPYSMAADCGAKPDSGKDGQATIADGSIVKTKVVKLDSVSVGQFTAHNIECSVLPADFSNAAPLLGLGFLNHFYFEVKESELVLSPKDAGTAKPTKRPARSKRSRKSLVQRSISGEE